MAWRASSVALLLPGDYSSAPLVLTPPSHLSQWHLGVKPGFHPLDHGYDEYLGLPESNDYGCTDSMMGAPDSGCLRWQHDRCPRKEATQGTVGGEQAAEAA